MLKLGIIGTNWITDQFIEAALSTNNYTLTAVYSRRVETAAKFAEKYTGDIQLFDDLSAFVHSEVDVIYIASPNSLHFEQTKQAILAGKNVIVEKLAFSTQEEMVEIVALSRQQKVCVIEAARHLQEENYGLVKEFLANKTIIGANFTYMKYSSRYDQVLAGEEPNIFSPKFSGGAIADIGVYPIYAAVGWFGKPKEAYYFARKIATGVDGLGTVILRYNDFDVTIQQGKIADSDLPSEIYLTDGTLYLNGINAIEQADYFNRNEKQTYPVANGVANNPMVEEAFQFAKIIENIQDPIIQEKYNQLQKQSIIVNELITNMRKQAGIVFAADKK